MCIKTYQPVYSCTGTQALGENRGFHVRDLTDLIDDRIVLSDQWDCWFICYAIYEAKIFNLIHFVVGVDHRCQSLVEGVFPKY